jgi:hypothetical protein
MRYISEKVEYFNIMKIIRLLISLSILLVFSQKGFGQKRNLKLSPKVYHKLLKAEPEDFSDIAKSLKFATDIDSTYNMIIAKNQGFVFDKPMKKDTIDSGYVFHLLVETKDKRNNKLILKSAKPVPGKAFSWEDAHYFYLEWDGPNIPGMWHRVLIYKK